MICKKKLFANTFQVVQPCHRAIVRLISQLDKFPLSLCFTLGEANTKTVLVANSLRAKR